MPEASKIHIIKYILLGFISIFYFESYSIHPPNYLCKGDGLIYYTTLVPPTTDSPDIVEWRFEGGDQVLSNKKNTDPVYYHTAGTFKTYNKSTYLSPFQETFDTFLIIVVDSIPKFYFPSDTAYCAGSGTQVILNTTSFAGVEYQWSTGATTSSITVNAPGTYSVVLTIKAGTTVCETVSRSVDITEYPSPSVSLGPDKFMCQNQVIVLNAGGGAGDVYLWQPNNEVTKTIDVSLPGIYKVRVTTSDGCFAEDEMEMIDSCPHYVFVPNAVSPNEDRLNDLFAKVWNFTPKEYTFRIFNRWGELLYETNDIHAGWDCKVNSELVCQDIYVYKITYVDNDKKWYEMRGTFFVVR